MVLLIVTTEVPAKAAGPAVGPYGATLKAGSVPPQYRPMIERAAGACDQGLTSPQLASQLQQESHFDANAVSPAGAKGIAQFTDDTWTQWGHGASVFDPAAAIRAQGEFMCDLMKKARGTGWGPPWQLALAGYNAGWGPVQQAHGIPPYPETQKYVAAIVAGVPAFTAELAPPPADDGLPAGWDVPASTDPRAATAIRWALAQRGGWYRYGGPCTDPLGTDSSGWCDCSSLVQQAYARAGIRLARVTSDQVHQGRPVNPDSPQPGDLVFTLGGESDASVERPGHVGLYIGDGYVVEAPRTGKQIRTVSYASWRNATSGSLRLVAVRRVVGS
ncbi:MULTISPECIES: NlpC/P60 family protein [Kitasatospora]|uniref:NlpC/P60 family protein n=1 Tax=Kitasatospora TaxID=2063 RepID=UPI000C27F4C8|nr:NlpC/P60 family protein [Kitasatospora sp. CB02891]PJN21141.1 glycoside hydrolase [Kitasatospora sp. CB02891]